MGDIFKTRKVPKHLIIEEEHHFPRKRRFNVPRLLLWLVLLLVLTGLILQLRNV